jgi:succinate dehydrogenase flavin-adding protein (antitoxin of CptAB toxin-antitoxin module)|tara:strand:+ start:779 stop:1027 length:249 start_codon:yes stop_codon:yes gene_type:complete
MNNNYKDKLKKIKYRCQTLGIKELDVIFERIYSKLVNTNDEALIDQLDDLLKNETQYIFDVFFNESFKEDRIKYLKIINLSK